MADPGDKERLDALEAEVEGLVGHCAELRAQLMEVQREDFVQESVEDATGPERQEVKEAAACASEAIRESEHKQQELQNLDEELETVRSERKRGRTSSPSQTNENQDGPARQLRRLERALCDSNLEEAQEQGATELVMQRLAQAKTLRASKLDEKARVASMLANLCDEAEEALQAFPEHRRVLKETEVSYKHLPHLNP